MTLKRIFTSQIKENEKNHKKNYLLRIINGLPGIRYRELLRITDFTNGTLSYHLSVLERNSNIKIIRKENSNITRYYPASVPSEEIMIRGFLKIKTTREIILMLDKKKCCTFNEMVSNLNKAPSTTSWNLKRLLDSQILIRKKEINFFQYQIKNPLDVKEVIRKTDMVDLDIKMENTLIE